SGKKARSITRRSAYAMTAAAPAPESATRIRSRFRIPCPCAVRAHPRALRIGAERALEDLRHDLATTAAHRADRAGSARLVIGRRAPRRERGARCPTISLTERLIDVDLRARPEAARRDRPVHPRRGEVPPGLASEHTEPLERRRIDLARAEKRHERPV